MRSDSAAKAATVVFIPVTSSLNISCSLVNNVHALLISIKTRVICCQLDRKWYENRLKFAINMIIKSVWCVMIYLESRESHITGRNIMYAPDTGYRSSAERQLANTKKRRKTTRLCVPFTIVNIPLSGVISDSSYLHRSEVSSRSLYIRIL